jgi:glucose/arabinose dehydrogenase
MPQVQLQLLVAGLVQPVYLTHAGDGSGRLFIVEQGGVIRIFKSGTLLAAPFLDITSRVISGGEQGLLSVAFHPDYETNGRFFVNYTAPGGGPAGKSVIAEYRVSSANPDVADTTERVLLEIPDPFSNHNGGLNKFGPDGYLYIGLGDGGSGGDPQNNAQRLDALLGKVLRIDVNAGQPYGIPSDNPFVGVSGARGEIWALGLRNPWRFSFDPCTNRLMLADVGQNAWEEVDVIQRGGNYGWRIMEGRVCFNPPTGCSTTGLQLPIAVYDHGQGCSVTGGYVYRGMGSPILIGRYLFGDYCSGRLWELRETSPNVWAMRQLAMTGLTISSFGEGEDREVYIVHHPGSIYRLTAR